MKLKTEYNVLPGDDRNGWPLWLERLASRIVVKKELTNALPAWSSRTSFLAPRLLFVIPGSNFPPPVIMQHMGDEMDLHILAEFAGSRLGVAGKNPLLYR